LAENRNASNWKENRLQIIELTNAGRSRCKLLTQNSYFYALHRGAAQNPPKNNTKKKRKGKRQKPHMTDRACGGHKNSEKRKRFSDFPDMVHRNCIFGLKKPLTFALTL
jgi:hypothetical protein